MARGKANVLLPMSIDALHRGGPGPRLAAGQGYPPEEHRMPLPADGYLVVAREFGQAVDHLRTWWPRKGEIVWELRQRGVSMYRIARLLRIARRTAYRWEDRFLREVAAYEEAMAEPPETVEGWL